MDQSKSCQCRSIDSKRGSLLVNSTFSLLTSSSTLVFDDVGSHSPVMSTPPWQFVLGWCSLWFSWFLEANFAFVVAFSPLSERIMSSTYSLSVINVYQPVASSVFLFLILISSSSSTSSILTLRVCFAGSDVAIIAAAVPPVVDAAASSHSCFFLLSVAQ